MATNTETAYEVEDGVILDGDTRIDVAPVDTDIEVVDDTPPADKGRTPLREAPAEVTDEELAKYSDQKLKDRLAHLGKGYHEERRAKESAARERDEAVRIAQSVVEENKKLQGSLANNQNALLEQAKKVVGSEIETAKREYKAAQEAFDTDGIIEAQQKLNAAMIKADRVNNFRAAPVQAPQNVVQPQPQVQQPQLDTKTREWNEQNPWFGSNRKMTAYALSLHEDLVESGVPVASDEYFNSINADIRGRFPETFAEEPAGAKSSQRTKSNVVAPASRSTAPRKVVLTQTQVNIAKRLGVPLELYARKVAEEMRKI
jgi:hypothetical protein